jgi:hypothetical protein
MPVLPGSDQAQVINPGTPIPVGSSESARYTGETIENFGKSLLAYGEMLGEAGTRAKNEQDKLMLHSAENRFRMALLEKKALQSSRSPIAGDRTGFGAVKEVTAELEPIVAEIADGFDDSALKAAFLNRSGDLLNDSATTIWADEVQKRANNNQVLFDKVIAESGKYARSSPNLDDTGLMMSQVRNAALGHEDLPPAMREIEATRAEKSVLVDSIQGRLSGRDYPGASLVLEQYGGDLFTAEERKKQFDEIQQTEWKDADRDLKIMDRNQRMDAKHRKDQEDKLAGYFTAALQQAGNDETKRKPIMDQIGSSIAANMLDPERGKTLIGDKVFAERSDDIIDFDITSKAISTGNYTEALESVKKYRGTKISYDRAEKMLTELKALQSRERSDPAKRSVISSGASLINNQMAPTITDVMSDLQKREHGDKVKMTVQQYYQSLSKSPDQDPVALSRRLIRQNFGKKLGIIRGTPSVYGQDNVQSLQKLKLDTVKQGIDLKSAGRMTSEKNKSLRNTLKDIDTRIRELEFEKVQPGEEQGGRPPSEAKPSATKGR